MQAMPKDSSILIAGQLDAKQNPLPPNEAKAVYAYASSVQPGLKLVESADASAVTAALQAWLR